MSDRTREINKITTTIIGISVKLIVYALIVLLMYEAVVRGYEFGHEIFYAEAAEDAPGRDVVVWIEQNESVPDAAKVLVRKGLIKSEFAFIFQSEFYDYGTIYPGTYTLNTSMTSKEILQALNVKPEDPEEAMPAQSDKAKSRTAAPAGGPDTREAGSGDANASQKAAPASETAGDPDSGTQTPAEEARDSRANEDTYAGEDQEEEGGWIEDAVEDGADDSE